MVEVFAVSIDKLLAVSLLLSLVAPVSAALKSKAKIAYSCFGVFIVLFVLGSLYVRRRRTTRSFRRGDGTDGPPAPVNAWAKAVPPKENGKPGVGPGVAAGEWERDA